MQEQTTGDGGHILVPTLDYLMFVNCKSFPHEIR